MSLSPLPAQAPSPVLPPGLAELLGPPPLLHGEDGAAYEALFERIGATLKPRDIVEWLLARDVVDAAWESARLRRLRASLRTIGQRRGLTSLLIEAGLDPFAGPVGEVSAQDAADAYHDDAPFYREAVERALAERGYLREAVEAQRLRFDLASLEAIDRMAAAADQRRDGVLRTVERRRAGLSAKLRLATSDGFERTGESDLG